MTRKRRSNNVSTDSRVPRDGHGATFNASAYPPCKRNLPQTSRVREEPLVSNARDGETERRRRAAREAVYGPGEIWMPYAAVAFLLGESLADCLDPAESVLLLCEVFVE